MIPIERLVKRILLALQSINFLLFSFIFVLFIYIVIEKIKIFNRVWKNSIYFEVVFDRSIKLQKLVHAGFSRW